MWKVIGNIYRVLESVCREQRDGFIKCPGCNGSGMSGNVQSANNENHQILVGQPCRFCEGYGILPLTSLRGFVLIGAESNLQTQDAAPLFRTEGCSLTVSSSKSCINRCTSIKFKHCLKTDGCLMNTIKSPPWLADVKQWLIDTSPFLDVDDTMPQIHHPNSLREVLFKSVMMCRLLYSAGLLISLASVLSSHSADAHVISSQDTLDDKETRNRDHESHETDAVFPIGKELDGWREPCRRVKKIRNYLRKKASEEAETRARWILMALVSKGSIS